MGTGEHGNGNVVYSVYRVENDAGPDDPDPATLLQF